MHRRALLETKKALRKVKEAEEFNFMYIDFVEGGCSDLFPEERRCIDVDELNKEAEQYFALLKGLIAFDIECALNHHVYAFLSGQLLDDMEQKMRTKIHEIAFKDNGSKISEMVGGQETLKKHIAEYKEELQSVEETLKQLDATGELEPAPKSQSSPAPMGGRDMALQSRKDILRVKGVVEFECMDLTKVKKAWASQFCQCAEEDIASCIGLERRKVKAIIDDSCLKYELEGKTPEQGNEMIKKLEDKMHFKRCARIYCKSLNLPSTCEETFAPTKSSKQTLDSETSARDDSDDATQGQKQKGAKVPVDPLHEYHQDEGRAAGKIKETDGEAPMDATARRMGA